MEFSTVSPRQFLLGVGVVLVASPFLWSADCNGNGIVDAVEIAAATSRDCNSNGLPDECDVRGTVDLALPRALFSELSPLSMATGDLDGDGDVDLSVISAYDLVVVLKNKGGWTFDAELHFLGADGSPPSGPLGLVVTDLDGDGHLDLATADSSGDVALLWSRGGGEFLPPEKLPAEPNISTVLAADLDSDGDQDLIVPGVDSSKVFLFWNQGRGDFAPDFLSLAEPPFLGAAGDVDGDGHLDLVMTNGGLGGISLFLNDGHGGFQRPVLVPIGEPAMALLVSDLDSDGDYEVVTVSGESGNLLVLAKNGAGEYSPWGVYPLESRSYWVSAADLDGDEALDLMTDSYYASVLWNDGKGVFTKVSSDLVFTNEDVDFSRVLASDFNQDGRPDLATLGGGYGRVAFFENGGGRTFSLAERITFGMAPRSLASGDLDGDGDLDLVVAHGDSSDVMVHWNNGQGAFQRADVLPVKMAPGAVLSADWDGDAFLDLVTANGRLSDPTPTLSVFRNRRDGTFFPPADFPFAGSAPIALLAGDLEGGGGTDLAVLNEGSGDISLFTNTGGVLTARGTIRLEPSPRALKSADLNHDGHLDLVVALPFKVLVLLNRGDGKFPDRLPVAVGSNPVDVALEDLDGDGDFDLATANNLGLSAFPDNVSVILNRGDGTFLPGRNFVAGEAPNVLSAADVDGDGDRDLVVTAGEHVSMLFNTGDGSFGKLLSFPWGGLQSLSVQDFDGDSHVDLAAVEPFHNTLVLLFSRPRARVSEDLDLNGVPDECEGMAFSRGDANGDGARDLSDAIFILEHLFSAGGRIPRCQKSADVDDSGRLNITDPVYLINFLFRGGMAPGGPFPDCGGDPTKDSLSCESYPLCN